MSVAGVDRSLVAHLFRRAAFGGRPDELSYYAERGYAVAVDDLLDARPLARQTPALGESLEPVIRPLANLRGRVAPPALGEIQSTWLQRMVTTTTPLVERMSLFLHDHFATGYRPGDNIDTPELAAQNDLFRANALGSWRTLCHAMIEDVALSCWLDNDVNHKQHPNENLAREFMELFTLGSGEYTEQDVREAARALTGFKLGYNLDATGPRNAMVFDPAQHDDGIKKIFGTVGRFMPHDFVDIVLAQPAASRFLARKLGEAFVAPSVPTAFIDRIAQTLAANRWDLVPALREIFLSTTFTAAAVRGVLVKSPAEFIAGSLRALGLTSSDDYTLGLRWMSRAGQVLYDPPNVMGWPRNEGWLGAGEILARYNAGVQFGDRHVGAPVLPGQTRAGASTPDGWAEIFGITELSSATRSAMNDYLGRTPKATEQGRDAALITLMISSPDFSLS